MRRPALAALATVSLAFALGACGTEENSVVVSNASADVKTGSRLFVERCASCHTLDAVGAQGSSYDIRDKERVDGPNFNVRKECVENVLYAIRNGGYSGAIMPENLAVGKDAEAIAQFLQKYSGTQRKSTAGSVQLKCAGE
ncbi:hypothetical protein DSM112329_00687 [Paraconexibacter sp. AEG42_29]|uniref:Cytochrome c domain-containing protein n=1 Tax=Paraconexibacter sp. AEG42_29 TaxID=2997339 RepID=A0AAU7AQL4_9ACTN